MAFRTWFPDRRSDLHWHHRILATGPPGKIPLSKQFLNLCSNLAMRLFISTVKYSKGFCLILFKIFQIFLDVLFFPLSCFRFSHFFKRITCSLSFTVCISHLPNLMYSGLEFCVLFFCCLSLMVVYFLVVLHFGLKAEASEIA